MNLKHFCAWPEESLIRLFYMVYHNLMIHLLTPSHQVIMRRMDGTVNFDRPYSHYEEGFGNKNGEYWLGKISSISCIS